LRDDNKGRLEKLLLLLKLWQ